jgi:hypothetical protein
MLNQNTLGTFMTKPDTFTGPGLGEGCFGSVTEATIPGFVVKTVENFWFDGWFPWALYCMAHQGEVGIPNILALRLDFTKGKLWALMEKLEPVPFDQRPPCIQTDAEGFKYRVESVFGRLKSMPGHLNSLMAALPDQAFRVDLHHYNYMMRGKKMLMTDPLILMNEGGNSWLKESGPKGKLLALQWARQTLDHFNAANDPRVVVEGSPEDRMAAVRLVIEEDEAEKKRRDDLHKRVTTDLLRKLFSELRK